MPTDCFISFTSVPRLLRMDEYTGLLESMERMYKLMQNRALAIINIEKAVSIYDNNNIFKEIEL